MIKMKNMINKIASVAMAFTLLGAGTTVAKNVNPKSDNTLVASAACQYHDGSIKNGKRIVNYYTENGYKKCRSCGQVTGQVYCSGHSWETTGVGAWHNRQYKGIEYMAPLNFYRVYTEERNVTHTCRKCGAKKTMKVTRTLKYELNGRLFYNSMPDGGK